jgi:exonuclease VII small subunit
MNKFNLTDQISKLETSLKKLNNKKSKVSIERYQKLKKKLVKCEKKINDYKVIIENPEDYADLIDNDNESVDSEKNNNNFNEYIHRLNEIVDLYKNKETNIDDDINNYVEATMIIKWCNKHLKSQKMKWEII